MKDKKLFQKIVFIGLILLILLSLVAPAIFSQPAKPHQEKLLNGLKVLMWPNNSADKVWVRVRVHAGSAFDPQGKEGLMRMLADNIFPDAATKEFFEEDLGGSLSVETNYDYIEVAASSKPDSLLSVLETLSTAVSNPTIDKEQTAKLRTALIEELAKTEGDVDALADHTAAKRLLGTFPYGRPVFGTPASVKTVEFPDLIDAKQRFLTADNATLAISGNFDRNLAFRAVRRYFGSWLKSDRRTPSSFRQPDDPPAGVLSVASPKTDAAAVRIMYRGTSRSDKDHAASQIFGRVLDARLRARMPSSHADRLFVRNIAHVLPGITTIGLTAGKNDLGAADGKVALSETLAKALADPITDAEFQSARNALRTEWSSYDLIAAWLDVETYKIAGADAYSKSLDTTTLADVNAFADKFRKQPSATVVIASPAAN